MPHAPGNLRRRDAELQERYDLWARELLDVLKGDPWNWHARYVISAGELLATDSKGLSRAERAAQRALYWNLSHAASSGLRIRSEWSLQVAWSEPRRPDTGIRHRQLSARVTPKDAGRRAVLIRGRSSYIASPTSRGALDGEDWQPGG